MKKYILGIAAAGAAIAAITATSCAESAASEATGKDYADLVNPLMGSQSTFELSTGNTYPAIARPWGMNFGHRRQARWATGGSISTPPTKYAGSNKHTSLVLGLTITASFR